MNLTPNDKLKLEGALKDMIGGTKQRCVTSIKERFS